MALDNYIPEGYAPHARPVSKIYYEAMSEFLAPTASTPVLDMPMFNSIVGGFRPYEFSILCGATGTGKTTLCANWSASWLRQGVPHFVASVETGHTDFVKRVVSAITDQDWNTGDPVPKEKLKEFNSNHERIMKSDALHLSLYENRFSVETLMADIAWHVQNHGIKVALIDNLNFFLEVTRAADQLVEMDRVIHELVIFSKSVPVHIVMLMHPKKTETGRVESEFDIKGSSTAVQEAYNVFLFNRPEPDMVRSGLLNQYDRELKIAKMRRRGKAVGTRVILNTKNGVRYREGKLL